MVMIMPMIVMFRRNLFARCLVLRQQGRLEAKFAQRILDFCDRRFVFCQRKVQPFARNGDLDVGNAGQAGERRFDLRRTDCRNPCRRP